jgi:G8 domain
MVRLDRLRLPRLFDLSIRVAVFVLCTSPATLFAHEHNAIATDKLPPLIRTAKNGNWSDSATWEGGKTPAAGERVQIRATHRVVYNVESDAVIRSIHVAGTLSFAPDRDTRLNVGLIKIQPGDDPSEDGFDCEAHLEDLGADAVRPALLVGTPERPIDAAHKALIRLTYVEGQDRESCPAIVCCGGRMDFHGAPMNRTWVKLGTTAAQGATTITLAEPVTGWRSGDRVVLPTTKRRGDSHASSTEERLIKSIDGTALVFDRPLDYEHAGDGDYRGEAANLSRNVIVESADPDGVRGHTMFHVNSRGSISYAEFRHLGKQGVLGRYSLHFHLVADSMRGSYVQGASIWDSANRWITIHGTNYLVVRDCVGYKSIGHGFFCEDGTEVYNVLDRNLAIAARRGKRLPKQVLSFDQNEGAGFWWANSLNTFTRNVAADNDQYGFRFEATASRERPLEFAIEQPNGSHRPVDIRTLPFVRFDDNEAHSSRGLYGVNLGEGVNRSGPDQSHPFIVRNLKIWDVHYAFRPQVPSLLVENLLIHRAAYGIYHPNFDNHVYRNVTISETNTEPFNRGHDDLSAQYGVLTVDGLTFAGIRSGSRMPLVQISDDNPSGRGESHFRNVRLVNWTGSRDRALVNLGGGPRPQPKTPTGVPVYLHDWFGPGRHALVVSTRSAEYKQSPEQFRAEPQVTGDESRLVEVHDVSFPDLLHPIDDLSPATVITNVRRDGEQLIVQGTTSDNGDLKGVLVNGVAAKSQSDNFGEWEATVSVAAASDNGKLRLKAHAIDASGNAEPREHVVVANTAE